VTLGGAASVERLWNKTAPTAVLFIDARVALACQSVDSSAGIDARNIASL
jgi:hypothetical protein